MLERGCWDKLEIKVAETVDMVKGGQFLISFEYRVYRVGEGDKREKLREAPGSLA